MSTINQHKCPTAEEEANHIWKCTGCDEYFCKDCDERVECTCIKCTICICADCANDNPLCPQCERFDCEAELFDFEDELEE